MRINKSRNVIALSLLVMLLAACSKNDDAAVATAELPQECEEFFRAMATCNAKGEKASAEEADKKYAELVQTYQDGAGGLKAEECKQAVDVMKDFQKTGC